jgi:hypothetical protein
MPETFMGVDVGLRLHAVIRLAAENNRAVFIGEVGSFAELEVLLNEFNVRRSVIDTLPDRHRAMEFAAKWYPRVWLCLYDRHEGDHVWTKRNGSQVQTIHANRILILDQMFVRFRDELAELPSNARLLGGKVKDGIGEYYREMTALDRTLERDTQGNWVPRYVDKGRPDHYAHAEAYCLLASRPVNSGGRPGKIVRFDLSSRATVRPLWLRNW